MGPVYYFLEKGRLPQITEKKKGGEIDDVPCELRYSPARPGRGGFNPSLLLVLKPHSSVGKLPSSSRPAGYVRSHIAQLERCLAASGQLAMCEAA